ncbi:elongation factor P [Candidatus Poribacteria bacterium]|nr:elongation factor P [Candidatus Poribacteria bacterium]
MASTADIRNGVVIRFNGDLHRVEWFQHHKPGKGGAFMRTKLRRLSDGAVFENTFRSGADIELVRLETREMQYLYAEQDLYYFMDNQSFEQMPMQRELLGDAAQFLADNMQVKVQFDGETAVTVELPAAVVLTIVETEPGFRGDTVSGGTKPAKLETGITIQVPLFVDQGAQVKVDTRTGEYLGRA